MYRRPTDELDNILKDVVPSQLDDYISGNMSDMADDERSFYYYFKSVIEQKDHRTRIRDICTFAGMSETYGSKLIRQEKHASDRDLILRLCIAGRFTLAEINKALKLYGFNGLYSKNRRDACIIVAVNNRIYDIYKIDEILAEHGFGKLCKHSDQDI